MAGDELWRDYVVTRNLTFWPSATDSDKGEGPAKEQKRSILQGKNMKKVEFIDSIL